MCVGNYTREVQKNTKNNSIHKSAFIVTCSLPVQNTHAAVLLVAIPTT